MIDEKLMKEMDRDLREIDKMKAVHEKSQAIGEFVEEFLRGKGIILAKYHDHEEEKCEKDEHGFRTCQINDQQPISVHYNITNLIAEFFNIDLQKVEEEKVKILEELRKK